MNVLDIATVPAGTMMPLPLGAPLPMGPSLSGTLAPEAQVASDAGFAEILATLESAPVAALSPSLPPSLPEAEAAGVLQVLGVQMDPPQPLAAHQPSDPNVPDAHLPRAPRPADAALSTDAPGLILLASALMPLAAPRIELPARPDPQAAGEAPSEVSGPADRPPSPSGKAESPRPMLPKEPVGEVAALVRTDEPQAVPNPVQDPEAPPALVEIGLVERLPPQQGEAPLPKGRGLAPGRVLYQAARVAMGGARPAAMPESLVVTESPAPDVGVTGAAALAPAGPVLPPAQVAEPLPAVVSEAAVMRTPTAEVPADAAPDLLRVETPMPLSPGAPRLKMSQDTSVPPSAAPRQPTAVEPERTPASPGQETAATRPAPSGTEADPEGVAAPALSLPSPQPAAFRSNARDFPSTPPVPTVARAEVHRLLEALRLPVPSREDVTAPLAAAVQDAEMPAQNEPGPLVAKVPNIPVPAGPAEPASATDRVQVPPVQVPPVQVPGRVVALSAPGSVAQGPRAVGLADMGSANAQPEEVTTPAPRAAAAPEDEPDPVTILAKAKTPAAQVQAPHPASPKRISVEEHRAAPVSTGRVPDGAYPPADPLPDVIGADARPLRRAEGSVGRVATAAAPAKVVPSESGESVREPEGIMARPSDQPVSTVPRATTSPDMQTEAGPMVPALAAEPARTVAPASHARGRTAPPLPSRPAAVSLPVERRQGSQSASMPDAPVTFRAADPAPSPAPATAPSSFPSPIPASQGVVIPVQAAFPERGAPSALPLRAADVPQPATPARVLAQPVTVPHPDAAAPPTNSVPDQKEPSPARAKERGKDAAAPAVRSDEGARVPQDRAATLPEAAPPSSAAPPQEALFRAAEPLAAAPPNPLPPAAVQASAPVAAPAAPPAAPAQATPAQAPTQAPPAPRDLVPRVVRRIAETGARKSEIVLEPAELGKLRFELITRGDRVEVHLAAERPETLDLLRNAASELRQEFRSAGLDAGVMNFSQWGQGPGGERGAPSPTPPPPAPEFGKDLPATDPIPQTSAPRPQGSGLDLRL